MAINYEGSRASRGPTYLNPNEENGFNHNAGAPKHGNANYHGADEHESGNNDTRDNEVSRIDQIRQRRNASVEAINNAPTVRQRVVAAVEAMEARSKRGQRNNVYRGTAREARLTQVEEARASELNDLHDLNRRYNGEIGTITEYIDNLRAQREAQFDIRDAIEEEIDELEAGLLTDDEIAKQVKKAGKGAKNTVKTVGAANKARANKVEATETDEDSTETDTPEAEQADDRTPMEKIRAKREAKLKEVDESVWLPRRLGMSAVNQLERVEEWNRGRKTRKIRTEALVEMARDVTERKLNDEVNRLTGLIEEKEGELEPIDEVIDQLEAQIALWEGRRDQRIQAVEAINRRTKDNRASALSEAEIAKQAKKQAKPTIRNRIRAFRVNRHAKKQAKRTNR